MSGVDRPTVRTPPRTRHGSQHPRMRKPRSSCNLLWVHGLQPGPRTTSDRRKAAWPGRGLLHRLVQQVSGGGGVQAVVEHLGPNIRSHAACGQTTTADRHDLHRALGSGLPSLTRLFLPRAAAANWAHS